jgi:hypothetical protein
MRVRHTSAQEVAEQHRTSWLERRRTAWQGTVELHHTAWQEVAVQCRTLAHEEGQAESCTPTGLEEPKWAGALVVQ